MLTCDYCNKVSPNAEKYKFSITNLHRKGDDVINTFEIDLCEKCSEIIAGCSSMEFIAIFIWKLDRKSLTKTEIKAEGSE